MFLMTHLYISFFMTLTLPRVLHRFYNGLRSGGRVACYHCNEKVSVRRVVNASFAGVMRPLCCHGCAAVLNAIEKNGLTEQYLLTKAPEPRAHLVQQGAN